MLNELQVRPRKSLIEMALSEKNMAQVLKLFSVMPKDLNLVKRLQEMNI